MAIRYWLTLLATILASAQSLPAQQPSTGSATVDPPVVENVDFERHVAPLFSRLGCNSGACHGRTEGQGGFRLSLFGGAPAKDYLAVTEQESRRVVTEAPHESLILAKPSRHADHEGGLRMPDDSWQYAVVRRWIADGARHVAGSGEVRRLVIGQAFQPGLESSVRGRQTGKPDSQTTLFKLAPRDALRLRITAEFADGTVEDVSAFVEFRSIDEAVATVDDHGRVTAVGPGYASIVASYLGSFAHGPLVVPYPPAEESQPRLPPANLIDEEIDRRLAALGLASSLPASDEEFLRRATLDVLGTVPTVDAVRDFLADQDPLKRARAIDRLLAHPRRAAVWASKMCDVTACNVDTMEPPEALRPKRAKMWHDWLRRRFIDNVPYDQLARGVLCATSRDGEPIDRWIEEEAEREAAALASFDSDYARRPGLDLYWRRVGAEGPPPVEDLAELTASAFLGLRLHCARCHHHPYDRWSQRDFAGFAQILGRVQFGASTALRSEMNRQLEARRQRRASGATYPTLPRLREVYVSATARPLIDAAPEASAPATAPGGPVLADTSDPRQPFAAWLTRPDNPFFARSFVNRVWAKYFGAGLVEPVDDMSASNPARHPALLERLAAEFVHSGYDIGRLERLILSSNAYQRSARAAGNNAADSRSFARATVRPLPAETLIDALNTALETTEDFGPDAPAGSTAHEVAPNRLSGTNLDTIFRLLGRGARRSLCDCDRAAGPSIRQPIFLMSDPSVLKKIAGGRLTRLLDAGCDDRTIIAELYLATLTRFPDEDELEFLAYRVSTAPDRHAAFADVLWAIVNTREFSTNH
ncbi:MAG TPA: DUF1549 and DUF1553 domain-containing protein [Pirellulales bacterium]|nr:DUF1549 and DUF1553 domain-containing protein [Pirellulales bacterium]